MNRARDRYSAKPKQNLTPKEEGASLPPSNPCLPQRRHDDLPARFTEDSPLIIDNTILSSFATCSTKALISYHHNLVSQEDSNPLLVGQAAHKALEVFFKGSSAKDAMKVFQEGYYPHGNLLAPEEPLSWENTSATMDTWFAGHSLASLSFRPVPGMIEGAIQAPLWPDKWGKRVMYLGLVDLLVQERATGIVMILDHKTTSKRLDDTWTTQFKTSAQLSGYVWLVQQLEVQEKLDLAQPINSAYINTIGFTRLPVSDRKCPKHAVEYSICKGLHATFRFDGPFQRSPLQLNQWRDNARKLARKWAWTRENHPELDHLRAAEKSGLFQYEACKFCAFTDFCSGIISDGKRLPEFLKMKAWTPWKEEGKNGQGGS
jgi:hypothetical protein